MSDRAAARRDYWRKRRWPYNKALIAACAAAAVLMVALQVAWHLFPVEPPAGQEGLPGQAEPFSILAAPFLFAAGIVAANVFYLLGPLSELVSRPHEPEVFRRRVFSLGLWASVALPLLVPTIGWGYFAKIHLFGA